MTAYLIPLIAFWFTNVIGVPQRVRHAWKKPTLKPFDCARCMGFWMAFIYECYNGFSYESWFYIPLCSLASWLLYAIALKLKLPIPI